MIGRIGEHIAKRAEFENESEYAQEDSSAVIKPFR
jgi:hypothetical protein